MVLTADAVLAAGTPDIVLPDGKDPWAAYEGRKGGKLLVVSSVDGTISARLDLASPPVPDGMALAGGKLYLAAVDGTLTCLGDK